MSTGATTGKPTLIRTGVSKYDPGELTNTKHNTYKMTYITYN